LGSLHLRSRCAKWYRVVVLEKFYEYASTVSGSPGIGASLPAGHVLKIALVTIAHTSTFFSFYSFTCLLFFSFSLAEGKLRLFEHSVYIYQNFFAFDRAIAIKMCSCTCVCVCCQTSFLQIPHPECYFLAHFLTNLQIGLYSFE
jgi:hypothetical protein